MHISITHLLYGINSSSVSESSVPTEATKQLVEEFRDTLNADITMTEKVCYLLLLEASLSHAFRQNVCLLYLQPNSPEHKQQIALHSSG